MDILNSFGDWLQLFVTIASVFFGVKFYTALTNGWGIFAVPFALVMFWKNVYDYDIVLGCIIGASIILLMGIRTLKAVINHLSADTSLSQIVTGEVITSAGILIVMFTKIALYW